MIAPEEVAALPDGRLDLIVTNSVAQYLTEDELTRLLAMFRRLLAPDGTLIFADVIPPDVGALSDVSALLRYAAKHGFLVAALVGLVKTSVSPYRKIRSTLGIAQYTRSAIHAEAHRRRICRRAPRAQHGAQSGAHDVPRAAVCHAGVRHQIRTWMPEAGMTLATSPCREYPARAASAPA